MKARNLFTLGILISGLAVSTGGIQAKGKLTIGWRGEGQELKVLKTVADAFYRKTGTKVQITTIADDSKLLTMFISGVSPDIFSSVFAAGLYDYARRNLCEEITSYIKRDKINLGAFYSGSVKRLKIGTKQYGLPVSGTAFCTWYNKALLDQAGVIPPPTDWNSRSWTWDDMTAQAVKLTKDTNGDGKVEQWGFGGGFWPINTMAWMWGGDVFPDSVYDDGLATKSTTTGKPVITALQKLQDLNVKQKAFAGWNTENFVKGKIGIYQDSIHTFIRVIASQGTKLPKNRFGVGIMPVGTAPAKPVIFTDPWLISKASKNKAAAWEWVKFCTLGEGASIMARSYDIAPMTKAHIGDYFKRYNQVEDMQKVTEGALAIGEESPNHTIINFAEINSLIEPVMQKVINGLASPAETMGALGSKLDAVLKRTNSKFNKR